jgi:hypothetical protein
MQKKELVQRENEVVIHQSIARLRGTLTPVQSRSMLSILKRANEQASINSEIKDFTIPTHIFLDDIQNKDTAGTVLKKIHQHLKKLMVQTFVWGTEEEINECIFMQQIKVTNSEVTFKFSDYIREHIKPISTALIIKDFELIQSFRSEYARQLYKHLMMWEKQQSLYLNLKDFRDFLGVPKTKSYEQMTNLKSKVLNVAIAEINEKCPHMNLQYTNRTLPRSKTIEGFNFGWFNKPKEEKPKENPKQGSLDGTELEEELQKYIGKKVSFNNYLWVIISISKNENIYNIFGHEEDDKSYTKAFEISKAQLEIAKDK